MIPPSKYWPFIAAATVAGFQLVWNATQYHNPITQADVAQAMISAGIALAFAQQCLNKTPPDGQ